MSCESGTSSTCIGGNCECDILWMMLLCLRIRRLKLRSTGGSDRLIKVHQLLLLLVYRDIYSPRYHQLLLHICMCVCSHSCACLQQSLIRLCKAQQWLLQLLVCARVCVCVLLHSLALRYFPRLFLFKLILSACLCLRGICVAWYCSLCICSFSDYIMSCNKWCSL